MQNQSMNIADRLRTQPVTFPRTMRPDMLRTVTSGKAGYCMPLGVIPLYREDALETTPVSVRCYMDETTNLLINSVNCVFSAYMVPKLAFDRFNGSLDALNRAYLGQPEIDDSNIPWIKRVAIGDGTDPKPFYKALGMHSSTFSDLVNSDYVEAYDKIFEFRCRQRSEALWEAAQGGGDGELHPAFFDNPQMGIVKSSFDDAMLEGQVPLTVIDGQMPVSGFGVTDPLANPPVDVGDHKETGGETVRYNPGTQVAFEASPGAGSNKFGVRMDGAAPAIFAEMQENGITVSIANIELATKTAEWAKVRARYSGLNDDQLIDLLMSGVSIPTQFMSQPQLIARQSVPFGMTQRYSSEAANLDVSATRGVAGTTLMLRAPKTNCGAVVVIVAEVVPEQFWERSKDYWLHQTETTRRPDRLLDQLDTQAVEVVENDHADVRHSDPTGVFGYAPLNHGAVRKRFGLGGKFYKADPAAPWSEDRNRIWGSEPIDPTLSKEFYLATDLPDEIFMSNAVEDNFEYSLAGNAAISGLTYLGPLLREQTGQYDAILDRVDMGRIDGTPVDQLANKAAEETEKEFKRKEAEETEKAETEAKKKPDDDGDKTPVKKETSPKRDETSETKKGSTDETD